MFLAIERKSICTISSFTKLFFYYNGTYVLLHHYRKKSQKTPQKEINRAKSEMKDYISRKGQ
jgi:phage-related protein